MTFQKWLFMSDSELIGMCYERTKVRWGGGLNRSEDLKGQADTFSAEMENKICKFYYHYHNYFLFFNIPSKSPIS